MEGHVWDFKKYANQTAVLTENGSYSYAQLDRETEKIAEATGGRCLMFCLCTITAGSLAGYTACLNHRMVPLMLARNTDQELLQTLINTYRPAYLWMPADDADQMPAYHAEYESWGYVLLKTDNAQGYALHEDLALLLTTSGSTGSPKLVRQTYQNILSNTESIVRYLELDQTERPVTTLPMNYTYGLSILNSHLYVGASVILTEKTILQRAFWKLFTDCGATSLGGVPYTYEMLDRLNFTDMDLPSLRTMTQAGGKLSPQLHKKFAQYAKDHGKRFYVMYGQTEATARMSYLPYEHALDKYGSMGIAIPGGIFRLMDENGMEIRKDHIVGELVYEGENVTPGYAECGEDLMRGDERGGVLKTGDMAERDADGYYYIAGRKKRFLKIFGSRVSLDEMERLIRDKFSGMECACTGRDDRMTVFITDRERLTQVQRFISEKTGLHHTTFHIQYMQKIPRNDAGKTLYRELERDS